MPNEQNKQKNGWDQLTQGGNYAAFQQQTYVTGGHAPSEKYLPAQGYAPTASNDGYIGSSNSYNNPYSAHESQRMSSSSIDPDDIPEQEVGDIISQQPQKRKSRAPGKPEAKVRSRRSILRERIARENNGEVSAADQPKGLVEWREGVFMWFDPEEQKWRRAAYHDQYRDQFLEEDYWAEGPYVVAPARGKGANDLTSSCSAFNQLDWRLTDRDSWTNITDNEGKAILYLLERPSNQSYDPPNRLWWQDGNVLLDGEK